MEIEPAELLVSKSGFSLNIKGFKPLSQVGQYAADAVGIIGEPLGMAKDWLSAYRVQRADALAAAMLRAKEISAEKGTKVRRVSPKFLAPWVEGASAEDIQDDNILELWAQLLSTQNESFSARTILFIDVLKRIGPSEAKILSQLLDLDIYSGHTEYTESGKIKRKIDLDEQLRNTHDFVRHVVRSEAAAFAAEAAEPRLNICLDEINKLTIGKVSEFGYMREVGDGGSGITAISNSEQLEILSFSRVVEPHLERHKEGRLEVICRYYTPTVLGLQLFELLNEDRLIEDSPYHEDLDGGLDL
ncbi:Abi-alpha family protein [Limimaricola sp.]|uniref:Abi-alpha family protein n=1 Tax=Limimaricola sp. TaxID=2211665 RepID=UPI00405976C2